MPIASPSIVFAPPAHFVLADSFSIGKRIEPITHTKLSKQARVRKFRSPTKQKNLGALHGNGHVEASRGSHLGFGRSRSRDPDHLGSRGNGKVRVVDPSAGIRSPLPSL